MNITAYNQIAQQQGVNPDHALRRDGEDRIAVREPLDPPGAWTKFKAALADVPLLGKLGSLRQARAEVDSFPLRLAQYQAENRQVLAGFLADMRESYGEHIADMAAREMNVGDGAPLTARTATTAMDNAERRQQAYRSMNNQDVTRFLENALAGGARARGETDMHGIWLDRGMPLQDSSSWQEAVGPGAARFITQQVMKRCAEMPEHAQGKLDNARIAEAAHQALDLYQELLGAPGMNGQALDALLARVTDARQNDTAATGQAAAREFVIVAHMERLLDHKDPGSMLRQAGAGLAREMDAEPVPQAVLKSIGRNMAEELSYRTGSMAREFGCAEDVAAIIRELEPRLEENVRAAIAGHIVAQSEIEMSGMNEVGQAIMHEIAGQRRFDGVQLREYAAMADAMRHALDDVLSGLDQGLPARGVPGLMAALTAMEDGMERMKEHGNSMWESNSLSGGEFTNTLMRQVAAMTTAGYDLEGAGQALAMLTSEQGRQLVMGMTLSSDMRMSSPLPMLHATLMESMALRAGHQPDEALAIVQRVGDGQLPTLHGLPSDMVRAILESDPGNIDARGVVRDAPHRNLVAAGFDPARVLEDGRDTISGHILRSEESATPGISTTMARDLGRSTFVVDGSVIGRPGGDRQAAEAAFLQQFPDDAQGRAMALAVSRCMNQNGINALVELNNDQAFPGQFASLVDGKTTHEAWPENDGSWTVRSTYTAHPNGFAPKDGQGSAREVETDGAVFYSITYSVRPPGSPDTDPAITVADGRAIYAF